MNKILNLSVHDIVDFLLRTGDIDNRIFNKSSMKEGTLLHAVYQKKQGSNYLSEVYLSHQFLIDEVTINVEGRADGIIVNNNKYTIDEIKTTVSDLEDFKNANLEWHLGQAKFYAYMFASENKIEFINVKLTYIQQGEKRKKLFDNYVFSIHELDLYVSNLLQDYISFYQIIFRNLEMRNASINDLSFPFFKQRVGQEAFMELANRTLKEGNYAYIEAPTGIGKTISGLFPYIMYLPQTSDGKIFYLTAKGSGKIAANNCLKLLKDNGLNIKNITITSKEKICPMKEKNCNPDECPYAVGYFNKIQSFLRYALLNYDFFDQELINKLSKENMLCPFEMELDLSLFCDVIICDYNYVFDPISYMQRYFDKASNNHLILIDEAHNLVDRSRDMYSASFSSYDLKRAKKALNGLNARKITNRINKLLNYLDNEGQKNLDVYRLTNGFDEDFILLISDFLTKYKEVSKDKDFKMPKEVTDLFLLLNSFYIISDYYGDNYISYIRNDNDNIAAYYYCLNASEFIKARLENVHSGLLFSATLSPIEYFVNTLGGDYKTHISLKLPSPFPKKNFKLLIAPKVSIKYKDREKSYDAVIAYIKSYVSTKVGNYFIYVPSYEYLEQLRLRLTDSNLDIEYQNKDMKEEDKILFVNNFLSNPSKTHIGVAVIGGAFSEGIDLVSDRLIGVVVVGVGIPRINFNSDNIMEYFTHNAHNGYEYAYINPGINKITQAIGRVIRSETDKGSALLIDNRFLQPRYRTLFEEKYDCYHIVMNPKDILKIIK